MSDPINRSRQRQRDLERAQFNASMKPEQARELHESVDREARDLLNALLDAMAIAQSDTNAVATPVANALCSLDVAARTAGFFDAAQLIIVMQAEVESALV
ncbi:MAG: hypothetical protein L6Q71_05720 [Planctomycetes bacterium]|nr:hypothetical protein [Planctomycetota bacterium]NUQ33990.1 hypothetical protein [Planctomycetaceae bacterium]